VVGQLFFLRQYLVLKPLDLFDPLSKFGVRSLKKGFFELLAVFQTLFKGLINSLDLRFAFLVPIIFIRF